MNKGALIFLLSFLLVVLVQTSVAQNESAKLCEVKLKSGEYYQGVLTAVKERKGAVQQIKFTDNHGERHSLTSDKVAFFKVRELNPLTGGFEGVTYEHPATLPNKVNYQGLLKLMKVTDNNVIKVYSYQHGFNPYPNRLLHLVEDGVDLGMWIVNGDKGTRSFKSTFKGDLHCFFEKAFHKKLEGLEQEEKFLEMLVYLDEYDTFHTSDIQD